MNPAYESYDPNPIPTYRTVLAELASALEAYRFVQPIRAIMSGGFILAFHDLPADRFVQIIEALYPARPVPLSELLERNATGRPASGLFAITFDDGVGETVRTISQALLERAWPATFYLPTNYIDQGAKGMPFQWWRLIAPLLPSRVIAVTSGTIDLSTQAAKAAFLSRMRNLRRTRPYREWAPLVVELAELLVKEQLADHRDIAPPPAITWDEVRRLSGNDLLSFESHGLSHQAISALTAEELEFELRESQQRIADYTGRPCRHFCYPYGGTQSIGQEVPGVVRKYYDSAVTMSRGRIRGRDPFRLPRVPLYGRDSAAMARFKVLTA